MCHINKVFVTFLSIYHLQVWQAYLSFFYQSIEWCYLGLIKDGSLCIILPNLTCSLPAINPSYFISFFFLAFVSLSYPYSHQDWNLIRITFFNCFLRSLMNLSEIENKEHLTYLVKKPYWLVVNTTSFSMWFFF